MGVQPLEFLADREFETHGLTGRESFTISGIESGLATGQRLTVRATAEDGTSVDFDVLTRIDTAVELEYYRHGGILQYVLRELLRDAEPSLAAAPVQVAAAAEVSAAVAPNGN
jgi:aconitate hydratase